MSEYKPYCIPSSFRVTDLTNQVFPLIGKLDETTDQLSIILENTIDSLTEVDNRRKEMKKQKKPSKQRINEEEQEIDLLRKTIDILATSKIRLVTRNYDLIDHNIKLVDSEIALLERALISCGEQKFIQESILKEVDRATPDIKSTPATTEKGYSSYYKRRKHELTCDEPTEVVAKSIDPNEPVYCMCNRIAFGDMIACDNEDCPIEWFHYSCVNLIRTPINAWLCPNCIKLNRK